MTDGLGRKIEYMRVSVTDRCNLRCQYCMPEDLPLLPHGEILRYEEILRICGAAAALGIRSFKVTGGEPFARKGCVSLLGQLKALPGSEAVSLTTNGVMLAQHVDKLAAMGIDGVNISLDTLSRDTYQRLTGRDFLPEVLTSLHKAVDAGLRVKINCVPLKGVNEDELPALAALAENLPVDVRFIELMPTGEGAALQPVSGEDIRVLLQARYPDLQPTAERRGWGPARYCKSSRLLGRIGFIDAVSNHFCGGCNRVRLTSDGFLKLCLYHDSGISLRDLIRGGADDATLIHTMEEAIAGKPDRHHFGENLPGGIRKMSKIGG